MRQYLIRRTHTRTHTYVRVYVCARVCACVCVFVFVCMRERVCETQKQRAQEPAGEQVSEYVCVRAYSHISMRNRYGVATVSRID